jgi:hypothetical protein
MADAAVSANNAASDTHRLRDRPARLTAQPATAAATTWAMPASPLALGWNGAAACVGMSGSTHFVDEDLQASWPMLAA